MKQVGEYCFFKKIPESLKQSRKRHRLPTEPLIGPKGDNLQQASIGWRGATQELFKGFQTFLSDAEGSDATL